MAFTSDSLKQIKLLLRFLNTTNGNRNSIENPYGSFSASSSSSSSSSEDSSSSNATDDDSTDAASDEYAVADYPGILDVDLTSLTTEQRTVFIATVFVLFVLSICGNIGTLFVNIRRKIRPFFRSCLISLAVSDLLSTIFLTGTYMSQFFVDYVQIWGLGCFMCSFVPFVTTVAILASSMILVAIALDRYFAVMKAAIGFWNPTASFGCICMTCIWAAAVGISIPVLWIYEIIPVYILTELPPSSGEDGGEQMGTNTTITSIVTKKPPHILHPAVLTSTTVPTTSSFSWLQEASQENLTYTLVREEELVLMCVSNKRNVGLYYVIVFSIIFIPCIIAFIWLNTIIAKKLWIRRHTGQSNTNQILRNRKSKSKSKSLTNSFELMNANMKVPPNPTGPIKPCTCKFGKHAGGNNILTAKILESSGKTNVLPTPPTSATVSNGNTTRASRHIRMFTIVILLMTVFLLFRLPAWIFLVMRMYGSYSRSEHWIIYFCFGILNLTSCVLNPLFYTFLAQTIAYITCIKVTLWDNCCGLRLCFKRDEHIPTEAPIFVDKNGAPPEPQPHWSCGCCCSACGLSKPSFFYDGPPRKRDGSLKTEDVQPVIVKQPPYMLKDDKDEGVECSDDGDEDGDSMNGFYNERVYTIFPMALVSTSMGSD